MNDLQMKPENIPIRTDFDAHAHAMSLPIQDVVKELTDLLGATNVAVIGGVTETRAVQQWTTDREPQRAHVLRFALQIATMIAAVADRDLARAWFHGSNPHLDDAVPLMMLRNLPLTDIQGKLMAAARIFAARPPGGPASS
ncbi:MAG: hypothetical protein JOZ50_12195 [Candidatus Eremiobacteraeota bacterium]|nr:hypothetical protein [Candidatus Eremiobacteraeota bacterium]MBV8596991.1 hypothetical protein [Candidatus Eremiobacteraeota bacterium]